MKRKAKLVTVHAAKAQLPILVKELDTGIDIIISIKGVPVARLVKFRNKNYKRIMGWAKGRVRVRKDFNAPLQDFKEHS